MNAAATFVLPPPTRRAGSDRTAAVLSTLLQEANRLAAAHDGSHDMCAAVAIVRGYASLYAEGEPVPLERLQDLLTRMRICERTGFFPKPCLVA